MNTETKAALDAVRTAPAKSDTAHAAATVQKAADNVSKAVADTVAKTVTAPAAKIAKASRKPATARRIAKPAAKSVKSAKTAKTAKRVTSRRAKPVHRASTVRAPKIAPAKTQIKRIANMTKDTNNWFANLSNLNTLPNTDKFQTLFADFGVRGQDALVKSTKVAEEFADITKANVEALVNSSRIAAAGAQSLGQEAVAYGRDGIEQASKQVKTLAEAKSPTEFFQLQGDFARAAFDRMVAESSRLTETMVKLAGEAIQPLSNRASVNAERLNTIVA